MYTKPENTHTGLDLVRAFKCESSLNPFSGSFFSKYTHGLSLVLILSDGTPPELFDMHLAARYKAEKYIPYVVSEVQMGDDDRQMQIAT